LPTTGDVVPLLQIAPSKTDAERLRVSLLVERRIGKTSAITGGNIREILTAALKHTGLKDPATGEPLHFTPRDFRRLHQPTPSSTDCRRTSPR
jgi:hypothetical protein